MDAAEAQLKADINSGKKTWGLWRYNASWPPSIDCHDATDMPYQIVLDQINTAAKLGDWLLHLEGKTRITPQVLGDLVTALGDLERIGYHHIKR